MATETSFESIPGARAQYLRPLWLGILFAVAGELIVFLVFGLLLNGPGSWQTKLLWTVGFCGIGMGSAFGARPGPRRRRSARRGFPHVPHAPATAP